MSDVEFLRRHDIRLKSSLGQNLLIDPNLCRKLVREARVGGGDAVLEIGPGTGALTEPLLDAGARVLAVETDGRLIEPLKERFANRERFSVVHEDILRFDRRVLDAFRGLSQVKVVANLPYYNSSQIVFRLLDWRDAIVLAVLTLQKEMTDRIAATPGGKDRGILSVRVQALAEVEGLFALPAAVFLPRPKVDSRAILLDFTRPSLPADLTEKDFARCVRAAFSARRKTLANALGPSYGRERATVALEHAGIDPRRRAETLTVAEFFALVRRLDATAEMS